MDNSRENKKWPDCIACQRENKLADASPYCARCLTAKWDEEAKKNPSRAIDRIEVDRNGATYSCAYVMSHGRVLFVSYFDHTAYPMTQTHLFNAVA